MKNIKKILIVIIFIITSFALFSSNAFESFSNGIYNVSYDIGGQSGMGVTMISRFIDSNIVLEKIDNHYYISLTQLSSSMENLMLDYGNGMQVGYEITNNQKSNKTIRYTIEENKLDSELPFSVYVSTRGETFSFTIKLKLDSKTRVSDNVDTTTDRPAEFVPVISTEAGDSYELKASTTFKVIDATAKLGDNSVDVNVSAYYNGNEIEINDNKLALNNVGSYKLIYTAKSSLYKTLLNNDSTTIKEVDIKATLGGSSIAKYNDINNVLPENSQIMASKITSGDVYDRASVFMKKIADNYEVFNISFISEDGTNINLTNNISISVKVKETFDRNKVKAYVLNADKLKEINVENGGSYVKLLTNETGIFIICVPGVAFHMPIWGYILICVVALVLIAGIVILTIYIYKKKKRKLNY